MASKTKAKTWLVQLIPPKGGIPRLKARAAGESRTPVRNYTVEAKTRAEAQSIVEAQERLIAEQTGEETWMVDTVGAA